MGNTPLTKPARYCYGRLRRGVDLLSDFVIFPDSFGQLGLDGVLGILFFRMNMGYAVNAESDHKVYEQINIANDINHGHNIDFTKAPLPNMTRGGMKIQNQAKCLKSSDVLFTTAMSIRHLC